MPLKQLEDFFTHKISFNEYITGNRFIDICSRGHATFCKTDYIEEYTGSAHKTFVTHNSDYHIDKNRFNLRPKGLTKWYCQNKDYQTDKLRAIPIGLENMTLRINSTSQSGRFSSEPPDGLKKAIYINKLSEEETVHGDLVYLNVNPNTFRSERAHVLNHFSSNDWVTRQAALPWQDYYRQIASHKFVFSPRGNGTDCHRTWEALYLRTIPIIKRSAAMNEFNDLPILFVDDWGEINCDFLYKKYEEMTSKLFDLSNMKISYWEKQINGDFF